MTLPLKGLSADAINRLEPHRMNNWSLEVFLGGAGAGPDQNIILGLQAFQLPTETSDLIEIYYMNERRQYAGRTMYDGGTLSLTDWIDQDTAEAVRKWRLQVYDPETGRIGIKGDYAKRAQINLYTPGNPGTSGADSTITATRSWELVNIWPVSVSWGALDMSASDKIQIDVQMVYDKAKPHNKGTFTSKVQLPNGTLEGLST